MLDYQTIYTAGSHKVSQLHEDASVRAAAEAGSEDRRSRRTTTLLWTLRLLAS